MKVPSLVTTMTPSATLDSMESSSSSKLSKSQKKRRKRKAAKGSGDNGSVKSNNEPNKPEKETSAPVSTTKTTLENFNSSANTRNRLVAEGYSAQEVEKAMDDMWNRQMTGYDDYNAVLAYLKGNHEAQDESTAPSTAPSDSLNGYHIHEEEVAEEEEEEESKEEAIMMEDTASISTASSQHLDMAARLDMVAESDDLGDSAFALNKWISEMAKQNEVRTSWCMSFCSRLKRKLVINTPKPLILPL